MLHSSTPGPDATEHVVAAAQFEHHVVDAGLSEHVRQQRSGRSRPDDHHWNPHVVSLPSGPDCTQDCRQSCTVEPVIIDCHGHYTTAPPQLGQYRDAQKAAVARRSRPRRREGHGRRSPTTRCASEPRAATSCVSNASAGRPHAVLAAGELDGPPRRQRAHVAVLVASTSNDLIRRVCDLYPENFAPVCQLPQSPGAPIDGSVRELRRCVERDGVRRLQPQPRSVRWFWTGPPLADRVLVAALRGDVRARRAGDDPRVSATCNAHFHTTGSHYLGADTTAFMQALTSGSVARLPGDCAGSSPTAAAPCPTTGAASRGWRPITAGTARRAGDHVFFDTCVYHQPGIDLLLDVVPIDNILFGSEMVGAVRGDRPRHRQPLRRHARSTSTTPRSTRGPRSRSSTATSAACPATRAGGDP